MIRRLRHLPAGGLMIGRRRSAAWTLCLVAAALTEVVVSAQIGGIQPADVRRPYRGLFGRPAPSGSAQALDLSASVYVAYDDDVFGDQVGVLSPDLRESGWYQGAQASLTYGRNVGRFAVGADAGIGVTRHSDPAKYFAVYRLGGNLGMQLGRRTQLSLSESLVYAPEFRLGLFVSPDDPAAFSDPFGTVSPDLGLFSERSYRTTTGVGVTHTLTGRSSLDASYGLTTSTYSGSSPNYFNQGGAIRYSHRVTRNAGLRLGYGYGIGRYSNAPALRRRGVHNIDAGIDYGRALSISRRTSLTFSTGSAVFVTDQGVLPGAERRVNYALLGSANLNHEIGRTWSASLAYRRSLDFHEGFADPFLSHAVSANVGGLISRRLTFSSSAALATGLIGTRSSNSFDSSSVNVGLEYALTRYFATYANYVYYRYNFEAAVAVDPRLPRSLERQGIRFGLSTSVPLIR